MHIATVDREEARQLQPQLVSLLTDAVNGGASVGFHAPLAADAATAYWQEVIDDIGPHLSLLVARDREAVIGSVQLHLAARANGARRAEVAKLLVFRHARRRGIGAALMAQLELQARQAGRALLILDTRTGDAAERLYQRLGWTRFGIVPRYTVEADGTQHDTSFFFKELG